MGSLQDQDVQMSGEQEDSLSYRLKQKSYKCMDCQELFRHLDPALQHVDTHCPKCDSSNCNEITQ
jgi:DNA-directed RNA polymerase subunit RPC12/RpoP